MLCDPILFCGYVYILFQLYRYYTQLMETESEKSYKGVEENVKALGR